MRPTVEPRLPSWWLEDALAAEGDPGPAAALDGDESADVAVVEEVLVRLRTSGAATSDTLVVAGVFRKHPPVLPEGVRLARTKELGEEDLLFLRYDASGAGG